MILSNDNRVIQNDLIRLTISDTISEVEIAVINGTEIEPILTSNAILWQRGGGYGDLIPLSGKSVEVIQYTQSLTTIAVRGSAVTCDFTVTYTIRAGSCSVEGRVLIKPRHTQVGWFFHAVEANETDLHWCYPWVSGDKKRKPTVIGREIGIHRPNHIWAALAGVPVILGQSGNYTYSYGFPVGFDSHACSLTYNDELENCKRLALGLGYAKGTLIEDSITEYLETRMYEFPFQICIAEGQFAELASEWSAVNAFCHDTSERFSPQELERILLDGRQHVEYLGVTRYLVPSTDNLVAGYANGSDDTRITIMRLARNAYVDYLVYRRTGDVLWKQRAEEQMRFLLYSQTSTGAFKENYDFGRWQYYFQGIDEFGYHPDQQAMVAEYILKLCNIIPEENLRVEWEQSASRLIDWLLGQLHDDGSISQTVSEKAPDAHAITSYSAGNMSTEPAFVSTDRQQGEPAPLTRFLCAFSTIAELTGRDDVLAAMKQHERWVIDCAYAKQSWWGHWPDTNLTTTIYGALKFIEYCARRFAVTQENDYLEMGKNTAYWAFFQTVPKQIDGVRNYTRGGAIEQDNYMQFNNLVGDTLIMSALRDLARWTNDPFLANFGRQAYQTTCHSVSDDPRHPWYGSGNMYLFDPLGLTVPLDTSPATGGATKYAGSVVPSILEDLFLLEEASELQIQEI